MFDYPSAEPNVTAWLIYDPCAPKPEPQIIQAYFPWDDTELTPLEAMGVVPPDHTVTVAVNFTTDAEGINHAIVNNVTYSEPEIPTLFTALTSGKAAVHPATYGNPVTHFVLHHLDMIYFVINNHDTGGHPCIPPPPQPCRFP
jgi:iron transport multicopper oxidase